MPISLNLALSHVRDQTNRLKRQGARGKSNWPKYLFHSCDVRTAVKIVRDGELKSRDEANGFIDVANQGALDAFQGSHQFARLYFRPKTPFHFRTEGIKCLDDEFKLQEQMSIPAMFVFDLVSVLRLPESRFSNGNVQSSRQFLDGDDAFSELDFKAIYHDAGVKPEEKQYIHNMRMSEVGVIEKVKLNPHLKGIMFRTQTDLQTFKYLLNEQGIKLNYRTVVERTKGNLFLSRSLYLSDLSFKDGAVSLSFHFPVENGPTDNKYKILIEQHTGGSILTYDKKILLNKPILRIKDFSRDSGTWRIMLEEQLAYAGELNSESSELY